MRLIDSDALKDRLHEALEFQESVDNYEGAELFEIAKDIADEQPTIDAIPVEWLRQKAEENSHYAEPYFAFAYVLHEWQQTKSIEELQAESEMRDWQKEQEER